MLFSEDFLKLLVVCLKMLFRKSTRKRFVCLVFAFLFMMGFNTYSYVMKFHKTENQKNDVLNEKAFKVFFLRLRTKGDCARFLAQHYKEHWDRDSIIIKKAFIYQNNLYVHFFAPSEIRESDNGRESGAMNLLYSVFSINTFARDFYVNENNSEHNIKVKGAYIDYNGGGLNHDILTSRHDTLRADLTDIAYMIREDIKGKRIDVFNSVKKQIIDNIKRFSLDGNSKPNPYLSRVESIIPMNFLHVLMNIQYDNTTDIMDLQESVKYGKDLNIETNKTYLLIPEVYSDKLVYKDLDIYPRYVPLYIPELLTPQWYWLLYQYIDIRTDIMNYIDQLHFRGHYLFSYEKLNIIKDKVKKINDDIHANHVHFYLTDLSMGIAFPFMISLFAFIHLKTEIAFLLMFKNRIRQLLTIFWLLPVSLMLFVKGGILSVYLIYLLFCGFGLSVHLALPLLISFMAASMAFYPINKWCFNEFTGDSLNLHALHKGR